MPIQHVLVAGGGAALAQPLIRKLLADRGTVVTALCRSHTPEDVDPCDRLKVSIGVEADDLDSVARWAGGYLPQTFESMVVMTGSTSDAPMVDMTADAWRRVVADVLTAPFNLLSTCLPLVKDGGRVVVVGSVVGRLGGRGCANYAAAKAGLVGLARAAANESADRRVRVNLLELGFVDAGMGERLSPEVRSKVVKTIPLRTFGTPDDFVHAVEFLLSVRYMTGGVLTLAGGL